MTSNADGIAAWRALAPWWDEHIGPEGSAFHRSTVAPVADALLGVRAGERVLDAACGNGQYARRLAGRGARVVAFDAAEPFIERARVRGSAVEYHVLDATDEDGIAALGAPPFDAAVANMALMDIAEIAPLLRGLARALRPGGRFVFTMLHPCFGYDAAGLERLEISQHVRRYLQSGAQPGVAFQGQPVPHFYFHRPLSALLAPAFAAGFVLDGLEEPVISLLAGRLILLPLEARS